jgi:hypothetical protein
MSSSKAVKLGAGPIIRAKRGLPAGELWVLFARDMGNYGRNSLPPLEVLVGLARLDPARLRPLAATRRRSGNFLLEGEKCVASTVEEFAEPILGLECVARRIADLRSAVIEAGQLPGFNSARQAVRTGEALRKVALTFVSGIDTLPDLRTLSSKNRRVEFVKICGGGVGCIISLYDRPGSGGDFGQPDTAVRKALAKAGVKFRTTTTRSVRVVAEFLRLAGMPELQLGI